MNIMNPNLVIMYTCKLNKEQVFRKFEDTYSKVKKNESMWIISDYEPIQLYTYFINKNILFTSYIISDYEWRIFVAKT